MYAKVFAQMYDGSLCTNGPWQALVTFQQFLVLADQEGFVDMTAEAISRRTTIPLSIIEAGIEELSKPDPKSRTPDHDGRRIIPISPERDWGWIVVNYKVYRSLKREIDRRDYHREYWHTREKKRPLNTTQHTQPSQPIADTYAEADTEADTTKALNKLTKEKNESYVGQKDRLPDVSPLCPAKNENRELKKKAIAILEFLNKKTRRKYQPVSANLDLIVARLKDGASDRECRFIITKKCEDWKGDEKMDMYLRPATLFNKTKFAQYQGEINYGDEERV
jgi:uncharacterized phage protein (TIGR02220 family)